MPQRFSVRFAHRGGDSCKQPRCVARHRLRRYPHVNWMAPADGTAFCYQAPGSSDRLQGEIGLRNNAWLRRG